MYLKTVLESIDADKTFHVDDDHLYKLNEAIFNLPEEDEINVETTTELFKAIQKIRKAFQSGKCGEDPNFTYDYIALLSTLQNQHFFSQKQTNTLLDWLAEAIKSSDGEASKASGKSSSSSAAGTAKDLARLEAENARLHKEIEQLQELAKAVQTIQAFKPPKSKGGGKGDGDKSNAAGDSETGKPKRKRGKGKGRDGD
eukprot:TRINITY_DN8159_c0_g3_i2.p1 TRINITY_DN8159_c0_g3~~TRINITY_DN8159_c0_g3_i2.p1  ORF type:complete len:199 (-),score=50.83 TRINITY_DN8159_c0_g3_i2:155-751(-)